jgi:hypothetical protein
MSGSSGRVGPLGEATDEHQEAVTRRGRECHVWEARSSHTGSLMIWAAESGTVIPNR